MENEPIIIPIASGKGGVGKSFVAANIAIAIASKSYKTIAIDLDLGGSNLYTYLGMQNNNPGLGDYLIEKKALSNYIVDTGFENLKFLPGEGRTTFMANLKYLQKRKLIKEIRNLEADFILLDLGAGTSFNTLDFFDLSNNGIIISSFEVPAVMNTLTFLKNYLFRKIVFYFKNNVPVSKLLKYTFVGTSDGQAITIKQIIEIVSKIDIQFGENIKDILRNFNPRIIFNMVNSHDELSIVHKVDSGIVKNLSLNVEYFGYIHYENEVRNSVLNRNVYYSKYVGNKAYLDINKIANKIITNKNKMLKNSIEQFLIE